MPTFTLSEPISNSFVYIDGEYIDSPYVVSVKSLAVCINGHIVNDYEYKVQDTENNTGRRTGRTTPKTVGRIVDETAERLVRRLQSGIVEFYVNGNIRIGYASNDGDGGATALIEKARKAKNGDEQAKQELITEMGL